MKRETIKHKFIVHRHSNVIRVTTTLQHCYNIVTTTSFMSQQRHNNVIDVTTSSFMSQNVWPMFTSLIQTKSSITLQINILSILFRSFFRGFHSKEIVETIQFEGMSTVVIRPCQLKPLENSWYISFELKVAI